MPNYAEIGGSCPLIVGLYGELYSIDEFATSFYHVLDNCESIMMIFTRTWIFKDIMLAL
jgi:hypothetical protein